MTPIVKLRLGDIFDGPSDLIVLPCSTEGTVSGFVARKLNAHAIGHPRDGMALGEVDIEPFVGGEHLAQYVAFAASVDDMDSSADAIELIGRSLGEFTKRESSVRIVAAPLLGAGAGGIQGEVASARLRKGFLETAADNSTLIINVLQDDLFLRLKGNRKRIQSAAQRQPRVFISHTSNANSDVEWIKELALFLIESGVQARLDRFHLRRGMDLPQWMCNELALADKVLVICDEAYKLKADGRLGGVGWETMIIQGDIATLAPDSTKYQVVVRAESLERGLPLYLKTRYAFHATPSQDARSFRTELLREILDLPLDERLEAREIAL